MSDPRHGEIPEAAWARPNETSTADPPAIDQGHPTQDLGDPPALARADRAMRD